VHPMQLAMKVTRLMVSNLGDQIGVWFVMVALQQVVARQNQ
jgi:hypothetical protein